VVSEVTVEEATERVHVDEQRWPLVISTLPRKLEMDVVEAYFAEQRVILERGQLWVHLVDSSRMEHVPEAKVRARIAALTKELLSASAALNVATAVVIQQALLRGGLMAIHWVVPPPHPFSAVPNRLEGVSYLCAAYVKRGMQVPPSMLRYRELLRSDPEA